MSGLLHAQSNATPDSKTKAPSPQSDGQSKNKTDTMVGVTKRTDQKWVFATKEGKTWEVLNPEMLKGHEGRAVQLSGTFEASGKSVRVEKVSNMACGPRFCERACKGKCGNGVDCDCPQR
jgi:hypothetical protein